MLQKIMRTSNSFLPALLRLVLGVVFFFHGSQKLLGWFGGYGYTGTMGFFTHQLGIPASLATLAIFAEFFGGIGLIIGFLTRIAAVGIVMNMFVAIMMVHAKVGFSMNWSGLQKGEGYEYHLLAIAIGVSLIVAGAGALSLDRLFADRISASMGADSKSNSRWAPKLALLLLIAPWGLPKSANAQDSGKQLKEAQQIAQQHLATFDVLDFDVFSNQQWDRIRESHSQDVTVHWPDGHITHGIDRHISDMKAFFVYAPDTRIKVHSVKIGTGEWTSVVGLMQGTFTQPMTTPDGKVIQPTGKAFNLPMCTVGHWKNGVMDEEYLFWDNATYMRQIGLGS